MLSRRSLLQGAGLMALSLLAPGCNNSGKAQLRVRLLKNSLSLQLLKRFRQQSEQPLSLKFTPESQLQTLFERLQTWKQEADGEATSPQWWQQLPGRGTPDVDDLVTLGDYWLESAIAEELIQPLSIAQLPGWQNLPSRWQNLVKRNPQGQLDSQGQIWAAPYRWGSTVIAYRRDKFEKLGWTPTDWSDLWREELRDRIGLLNDPREVIGLTLKKLGQSYNTQDLNKVARLESQLRQLNQQVKFYSSTNYLQPLILGDTWLTVGWSTDIFPIQEQYPTIEAVIPQSGTALWTDVWVQPNVSQSLLFNPEQDLIQPWINFCWQPEIATLLSQVGNASSPILFTLDPATLPKIIAQNPLLFPDPSILEKSEFLQPLPDKTLKQYEEFWIEMHRR